MEVLPLAGRTLGSPEGDFVVVEWEDDGTPHSYWNGGRPEPARYLLVMTSRIFRLVEELHTAGFGPEVWARATTPSCSREARSRPTPRSPNALVHLAWEAPGRSIRTGQRRRT